MPVLPLKLYSESKLVETKQVQRVGAAKGVMDSVTKDCFLHHINKLQELRAVVAPRSGQEYCVLSEQAAAYWRKRVADVNDEDFLSLCLAAVPTEINLRAMFISGSEIVSPHSSFMASKIILTSASASAITSMSSTCTSM